MDKNQQGRKGFVFYQTWWIAIANLPRDIQGDVLTAIIEYGLYGETTDNLKPIAKAMLEMIKPQIDANKRKYENGTKGGRPPKTENKPNENQTETKVKPNENQIITKQEPEDKNKYKDSEDKSSSSCAKREEVEDELKNQVEEYKTNHPLWKESIERKHKVPAAEIDSLLDKFYLDMKCKEIQVYKLPALFDQWLTNLKSNERTENRLGYQSAQGRVRSKRPEEPGYGLVN